MEGHMPIVLVFSAIAIPIVIFVLLHLRPLTDYEINQLGNKRRRKKIREYYSFSNDEFNVGKEFKKRMDPSGRLYSINESLRDFPSLAAALLKYKKHEWVIVAFEKNMKVESIWLNKGVDRSQVSLQMSTNEMISIAQRADSTTVLFFHNHPNSNPNYFDCTKPSKTDIVSANNLSVPLNSSGVNLFDFVCERGRHYQYFSSVADHFMPLSDFTRLIAPENNKTRIDNLLLHTERLF